MKELKMAGGIPSATRQETPAEKPGSFFPELKARARMTPDGDRLMAYDPTNSVGRSFKCTQCGVHFLGGGPALHVADSTCAKAGYNKPTVCIFGPKEVAHFNEMARNYGEDYSDSFLGMSVLDLRTCYPELMEPISGPFQETVRATRDSVKNTSPLGVFGEPVLSAYNDTVFVNYKNNPPKAVDEAVQLLSTALKDKGLVLERVDEDSWKVVLEKKR